MSDQQPVDLPAKIKDLEEENELLLNQLFQVQEELEVYFLKYKDLESGRGDSLTSPVGSQINWVDDELPEALAEVERLNTLSAVQAEIKEIESRNALNIKLGNMLLEASSSVGGISKLPFSLLNFWKKATQTSAPSDLGGKEFTVVTKAYEERGFVGVKSILKGDVYSPIVQGNAYTALARHLMRQDAKAAAEAASKAFEIDPKPYRLKWLAFKLHDAGDLARAEAMLDLLPLDTKFSDSEERQVRQLRYEAKNARQRQAKQKTGFLEGRAKVMGQIDNLTRERNDQSQLAAERQQTIEVLQQSQAQLEADKTALIVERDQQAHLVAERQQEIDVLSKAKAQIEAEMLALAGVLEESKLLEAIRCEEIEALKFDQEEALQRLSKELESAAKAENFLRSLLEQEQVKNLGLVQARHELIVQIDSLEELIEEATQQLHARGQEIEALRQTQAQLEADKAALAGQRDEQSQLAAERQQTIEVLQQSQAQIEAEKAALASQRDEQAQVAAERQQAIEALQQTQAQIEAEKAALAGQRDEQSQLAAERQHAIEALQQTQAQLEADKAALAGQRNEQAQVAAERQQAIEALQQTKDQLEAEKASLAGQRDEQVQVAAERQQAIEALQQTQAQLEADKATLAGQRDEQSQLAAERQQAIEALQQTQAQLEAEKASLAGQRDEQAELAAERQHAIETLQQTQAQLEAEKAALAGQRDEQSQLAAERQQAIEALQQRRDQLEAEKASLAGQRDEQAELAAERQQAIEALQQTQAQLEADKAALAGQRDQQAQVAAERQHTLKALQQQIREQDAGKTELASRQQLIHQEMVRAEAQIDLIKDMLLREPGL